MASDVNQSILIGDEKFIQPLDQEKPLFAVGRPIGVVKRATCRDNCHFHIRSRRVGRYAYGFARPRSNVIVGLVALGAAQLAIDKKHAFGKYCASRFD
jgi:hypothetical protein